MPTGPKGQKRKADVVGNAVLIWRMAIANAIDDGPDGSRP